jgi:hypothetical protein
MYHRSSYICELISKTGLQALRSPKTLSKHKTIWISLPPFTPSVYPLPSPLPVLQRPAALPRTRALRSSAVQPVAAIGVENYVDKVPDSLLRVGIDDLPTSIKARFEKVIRAGQDAICKAVSEVDGKEFHEVSILSGRLGPFFGSRTGGGQAPA